MCLEGITGRMASSALVVNHTCSPLQLGRWNHSVLSFSQSPRGASVKVHSALTPLYGLAPVGSPKSQHCCLRW